MNTGAQQSQNSVIMRITPNVAETWLKQNLRNRKVNDKRVKQYADDMRQGRWGFTNQGIGFYSDGMLADGQHRLLAVVDSGVPIQSVVVTGIAREDGLSIDTHQKRDISHSIRIAGISDWIGKNEVAVLRVLDLVVRGSSVNLSEHDIVDLGNRYESSVRFGCGLIGVRKKYLSTAIMFAAIGIASKHEDHTELQRFYDVLTSGITNGPKDKAAIHLREWLYNTKHEGATWRLGAVKRITRAIKAFVNGEELSRLYEPKELVYQPVEDAIISDS